MKETKKITNSELRQLIKEEVARAQKIKTLKEEKKRIEKILSEMEGMDDMGDMANMEEYSEATPLGQVSSGTDIAALEKELASKIKLDPSVVAKMAEDPAMMAEGIMDTVKGIFGKKDAAKKEAPAIAASAGIKSAEDFKDEGKMQKFVGDILAKMGVTAGAGGAGTFLASAIISAIKGSAYAAVAMNLPVATIALLIGGLVIGVAGSYMKYEAGKKGAK